MFLPSFGRCLRTSIALLCSATPVFPQSLLPQGSVVITHVSPDFGLSTDEFVVLYNAGPDTVDLDGYELRYGTASGSIGSAGAIFSAPTILPPARHLLVATRETVAVGTAIAVRDAPFTSGMSSTGGQLLLRRTDQPDSIVFASAWGSITTYLAGMTDAATWGGDGMLSLRWNGSAYERLAFNSSNLQYEHTPSLSIMVVPSLHPIVPPSPWTISVVVEQGSARDSSVVFGMSTAATDSFDIGLDLPAPPPPIAGQLSVSLERPDHQLATGDYVLRDFVAVRSLSDTSAGWVVSVIPAAANEPAIATFILSGLPSSLPVRVRRGSSPDLFVRTGDEVVCTYVPETSDRERFFVSVGDSVPPVIQFIGPSGPTAIAAGSDLRLQIRLEDGSGLDSVRLSFVDRQAGTESVISVVAESLSGFWWRAPDRTLSDSACFRLEAVDKMGNIGTAASANVRIVPDTAGHAFEPGWHLISSPLEPIDRRWSSVAGGTTSDSAYPFSYARNEGYRPADSLLPGHGYFLGLLRPNTVTMVGLRAADTAATPLTSGFVLIGNARPEPAPLSSVVFIRAGIERTHTDAITSGWVGAGLYEYDRTTNAYRDADTLQPWKGYWLPVLEEGISFRVPASAYRSMAKVRSKDVAGWYVRMVLRWGEQADSLIRFGADAGATDGFDAALDLPAPPPPPAGRAVSAWFAHPEWELPTGPDFLNDIRSLRDGHEWTLWLRSNLRRTIVLTWSSEGSGAAGYLGWYRPSDGWVRYLAEGDTVHLELEGTTSVILRPTSTGAVPQSDAPDVFLLSPGYPNPFNATTHFDVEIPRPGRLTMCVYDLLGREVQRLIDIPVEPGGLPVDWNPSVSTGVYVVRAWWREERGANWTQSRRVILVR